ncbi:Gfo/Idh/MocA family oxidoreductase [Gammaproteobacteria bacterium AS21]
MSKPKKLRVACVGTGYFSQFHYQAWQRMDDVEIVAICNRDIKSAQAFAQTYDIAHCFNDVRAMLAEVEVDLLDIITPPLTHQAAVDAAIEFGVNAICQKPFGENLAQARAMTEAAAKAGIDLCIHENFRFMPWIREIGKIIETGQLGALMNVRFALRTGDGQGENAYLERQPYFQQMPKLLIHETGIHFVDCFRFLLGEPSSVYASLKRCNPVIKGEDAGHVLFEYSHGLTAVFDGNRLLDHASSNTRRTFGEMYVEGAKGSLRLDGEANIYIRKFGDQQETLHPYQWDDVGFGGDCVYRLNRHVADHYLRATALENRASEYLQNIHLEEAIYHSNEQGRRFDF